MVAVWRRTSGQTRLDRALFSGTCQVRAPLAGRFDAAAGTVATRNVTTDDDSERFSSSLYSSSTDVAAADTD